MRGIRKIVTPENQKVGEIFVGKPSKLVAYVPNNVQHWVYREVSRAYPKHIPMSQSTHTVFLGSSEPNHFTVPLELGEKIWLVDAHPDPWYEVDYNPRNFCEFNRRDLAEAELRWMNLWEPEEGPRANYRIECITFGWISPDVLRRTNWRPPWAPIGLRDEDQPFYIDSESVE